MAQCLFTLRQNRRRRRGVALTALPPHHPEGLYQALRRGDVARKERAITGQAVAAFVTLADEFATRD
jgi:hypothetical protein